MQLARLGTPGDHAEPARGVGNRLDCRIHTVGVCPGRSGSGDDPAVRRRSHGRIQTVVIETAESTGPAHCCTRHRVDSAIEHCVIEMGEPFAQEKHRVNDHDPGRLLEPQPVRGPKRPRHPLPGHQTEHEECQHGRADQFEHAGPRIWFCSEHTPHPVADRRQGEHPQECRARRQDGKRHPFPGADVPRAALLGVVLVVGIRQWAAPDDDEGLARICRGECGGG